MSKYKTIAAAAAIASALGAVGVALKEDIVTAYGDVKTAVERFKIKLEIKGLTYAGKKNLDVAAAMAKASDKALEDRRKNIDEAAKKAERIVVLQKKLEA